MYEGNYYNKLHLVADLAGERQCRDGFECVTQLKSVDLATFDLPPIGKLQC